MEFKLLTPDQEVFSGEVTLVGGRTEEGSFSLLPRHMPAVMELESAVLKVETGEETEKFVVHGGFLFKERDETVNVLTREAWNIADVGLLELKSEAETLEEKLEEIDEAEEPDLYERTRSELEKVRFSVSLVENE
ncbi:MAG: FoF1 ATP synthase subunit delta/epsilon [Candidatus Bipolaricaulota bacterium]